MLRETAKNEPLDPLNSTFKAEDLKPGDVVVVGIGNLPPIEGILVEEANRDSFCLSGGARLRELAEQLAKSEQYGLARDSNAAVSVKLPVAQAGKTFSILHVIPFATASKIFANGIPGIGILTSMCLKDENKKTVWVSVLGALRDGVVVQHIDNQNMYIVHPLALDVPQEELPTAHKAPNASRRKWQIKLFKRRPDDH